VEIPGPVVGTGPMDCSKKRDHARLAGVLAIAIVESCVRRYCMCESEFFRTRDCVMSISVAFQGACLTTGVLEGVGGA
jgi:hypothetical protein